MYIPRILDMKNTYVMLCFLTDIQPPFYDIRLTQEQTFSEWQVFEKGYEYARAASFTEEYTLHTIEEYLDRYYQMQTDFFQKRYIERKKAIMLNAEFKYYAVKYTIIKSFLFEPFVMPDNKYFMQARAICQHFYIASLCVTYTEYTHEEKEANLQRIYAHVCSTLNSFANDYASKRCLGFNWLNLKIFDNETHIFPLNGIYCPYTKTISLYNYLENKEEIFSIFVHEYVHLIDLQHYSIFNQRNNFHEDLPELFSFCKQPKIYSRSERYANNDLYQIKNNDYHLAHSEYINEYNELIYLNLSGKNLNLRKQYAQKQKTDFTLLINPVIELIKENVIINTTSKKFISDNIDYLSDFISSFRYIFDLDITHECYKSYDGVFSKFLAYDVYMKYSLMLDKMNPEYSKEKFLHLLFLKIMREYAKKRKELNQNETTILQKRVYNYLSTVGMYILPEKCLNYMKDFYYLTYLKEGGLYYYSLPGELLAFSVSDKIASKSKRILKKNVKFFKKYISYINYHSYQKNKSRDYDVQLISDLLHIHYEFEWRHDVEVMPL